MKPWILPFLAVPVCCRAFLSTGLSRSQIYRTMADDIPDMDELRRLRLAHFDKNGSTSNDMAETTREPPRKRSKSAQQDTKIPSIQQLNPAKNKISMAKKDVIDLCDDSTDDDESVIEIVEQKPKSTAKALSKGQSTNSNPLPRSKPTSTTKSSPDFSSWIDEGQRFQVATYNIWFGPEGNGQPYVRQRMEAIASLLAQEHSEINPLWFVGFQEIVQSTEQVLHPLMENKGYKMITQPYMAYGVSLAVLTRAGCPCPEIINQGWKSYACTKMDRGFCFAHCRLPGPAQDECIVTNTHLESFVPGNDGSAEREVQVKEAASFCLDIMRTNSRLKVAIIMGDLNWDDGSRKPKDPDLLGVLNDSTNVPGVQGEWEDSWKETVTDAKDMGYTYDSKLNPMLRGSLRRRFDRVLVFRRKGDTKICCSTTCIGKEGLGTTFMKVNNYVNPPVSRETPTAPSDHFGLVSQLALDKK